MAQNRWRTKRLSGSGNQSARVVYHDGPTTVSSLRDKMSLFLVVGRFLHDVSILTYPPPALQHPRPRLTQESIPLVPDLCQLPRNALIERGHCQPRGTMDGPSGQSPEPPVPTRQRCLTAAFLMQGRLALSESPPDEASTPWTPLRVHILSFDCAYLAPPSAGVCHAIAGVETDACQLDWIDELDEDSPLGVAVRCTV